MVSTNRRWMSRNAITMGTMASTDPAMIRPYWMTCWPRNRASPEDSVYMKLLVEMMSGHRRSFQLYIKWNSPSVSMAGTDMHQDDAPVDLEVRCAIHAGGVFQFLRNAEEELAQEEDPERVSRPRQDQPLVGVHPVELGQQQEERHQVDPEGKHQGDQDEHEDDVLAREVEPRKRVGGQRVEGERQDRHPAGE